MEGSHHDRITDVFLAVCNLEAPQQFAELERLCGDDTELRREVMELLGFDEDVLAIDTPAFASDLAADVVQGAAVDPPTHIGSYRVLDVLGEGGMGVVYRVHQDQPDRVVALKVLRAGLMTPELQQRFAYEAQILGRLQHPGIAQIFESGQYESALGPRPYFAMELVHGAPITEYADREGLGLRDRLQLVVKLCAAVQHAHERGVIHRDLKPANVLVDGMGQPKVLDFGVSRQLGRKTQMPSMHTQTGALVGTIAYMSTEQVKGDHGNIDTRSDVYALGVVLFELVTGELPYPIAHEPLHVAVQLVLDSDPQRAGSFNAATRGEIEAIIQMALAKDKRERYASASELGADIGRYLRNEPLEAKRAHPWYVLRKTLRRHRVAVAIASLFAALLVAATVITVRLYRGEQDAVLDLKLAKKVVQDRAREATTARDREKLERYAAQMSLAFEAYASGEVERARQVLDRQVPEPHDAEADVRGFEWYWLDAVARTSHSMIPAHLAAIRALEVSVDETRVAYGRMGRCDSRLGRGDVRVPGYAASSPAQRQRDRPVQGRTLARQRGLGPEGSPLGLWDFAGGAHPRYRR